MTKTEKEFGESKKFGLGAISQIKFLSKKKLQKKNWTQNSFKLVANLRSREKLFKPNRFLRWPLD